MGLFGTSALLLFLELALIRWLPAHALYLTFFTNVILLGSFLGLALGCLRRAERDLTGWTPAAVGLTMALGHLVERLRPVLEPRLDVGGQSAPQLVFFGAEAARADLAPAPIPIEALCGLFFLLTAACLYGPGQELGRRLEKAGGGARAYGLNLLGSLAGVLGFALASRLELTPVWWLLACAVGFEALARSRKLSDPSPSFRAVCWAAALGAAALTSGPFSVTVLRDGAPLEVRGARAWSPYYRVDWFPPPYGDIRANLLGHQRMTPLSEPDPTYALPHLLRRDSGGAPFADVLVIGAGSGNDVARALQFGAASVDAVEIDPAIQRIGMAAHPDKPYADPRVRAVVADGREFLERGGRSYDLIVYALVDSLVLHSGYSSLRLESHLFTSEALAAAKRRLKPGGVLVLYNFYRQGWVAGRIAGELSGVFGAAPLVITSPHRPELTADTPGGFTVFLAGGVEPLRAAFARSPLYRVEPGARVQAVNGFRGGKLLPGEAVNGAALSAVRMPPGLEPATDDWPFLYLRSRALPGVTLRGMAVMGALAALLLLGAAGPGAWRRASPRPFFLGAGFMLLETRAVVAAARWFGGTWTVNAFVFAGVLLLLAAANLLAARLKPQSLAPWYGGLFASLALSAFLTPGSAAAALVLLLAPLFFAGVVFSSVYAASEAPAEDFAANVAGAMLGGLAENLSLLLGFRGLAWAAAAFYASSLWDSRRRLRP